MLHVACFDDLRPYGIIALTGESCGLMYRILCDVTERGRLILAKALGISHCPRAGTAAPLTIPTLDRSCSPRRW